MSGYYKSPAKLLGELGITEPSEIDIEAISQYCGATIVYERLEGCAARIIGNGDRAIITIDSASPVERRRFSAGHELGHWMRDRQKIGFSCTEQVMVSEWTAINPERAANDYSANVLLPEQMFKKAARNKPITFDTVFKLGESFVTSATATAIRLVQHGSFPAMLVYSEKGRRKWFIRGEDVHECLWPREEPGRATTASDLIRNEVDDAPATTIQADGWISHPRSKWYEVVEHSIRVSRTGILTLLWWKNEKQLLDLNDDE